MNSLWNSFTLESPPTLQTGKCSHTEWSCDKHQSQCVCVRVCVSFSHHCQERIVGVADNRGCGPVQSDTASLAYSFLAVVQTRPSWGGWGKKCVMQAMQDTISQHMGNTVGSLTIRGCDLALASSNNSQDN